MSSEIFLPLGTVDRKYLAKVTRVSLRRAISVIKVSRKKKHFFILILKKKPHYANVTL